jgi:hypothetical protein
MLRVDKNLAGGNYERKVLTALFRVLSLPHYLACPKLRATVAATSAWSPITPKTNFAIVSFTNFGVAMALCTTRIIPKKPGAQKDQNR